MFAVVTPEYFLRDGTRVNVPNLDGSETIAAYCGGSAAWKVAARVSYLSPEEADALAQHLTGVVPLENATVGNAQLRGSYAVYGQLDTDFPSNVCVVRNVAPDIAQQIAKWMRMRGWACVTVREEQ